MLPTTCCWRDAICQQESYYSSVACRILFKDLDEAGIYAWGALTLAGLYDHQLGGGDDFCSAVTLYSFLHGFMSTSRVVLFLEGRQMITQRTSSKLGGGDDVIWMALACALSFGHLTVHGRKCHFIRGTSMECLRMAKSRVGLGSGFAYPKPKTKLSY